MWRVQTACLECLPDSRAGSRAWRRKQPRLANEIGKLDPAPTLPWALASGHQHQRLIHQQLRAEVIFRERHAYSPEDELDIALAQLAIERDPTGRLSSVKGKSWVSTMQPADDHRKKTHRHRIGATDAQFAHGRISQELDLFDALSQLVEDGDPMLEQGAVRKASARPRCGCDRAAGRPACAPGRKWSSTQPVATRRAPAPPAPLSPSGPPS